MRYEGRKWLATSVFCIAGVAISARASAMTNTVSSFNDAIADNGDCSLREALAALNNQMNVDQCLAGDGFNDTIILPYGYYGVTNQGSLEISRNVSIEGSGALMTVIDAGTNPVGFKIVNGAAGAPFVSMRAFSYQGSSTRALDVVNGYAVLDYMKILDTGNDTRSGTAVAVYEGGSLYVYNSLFRGCHGYSAGALVNLGYTEIYSSSIVDNVGEHGGGLHNAGSLAVYSSTIAKNAAAVEGGALLQSQGNASIQNSTIAFNISDQGPQSACGSGCGAVHVGAGSVSVSGSVIARNDTDSSLTAHVDCQGTVTSEGGNLLGATSGTGCSPGADDLPSQDPGLRWVFGGGVDPTGWPDDIGGMGLAYALEPWSPLVNALPRGSASCFFSDQRGLVRGKGDGSCDIGAVERSGVVFIQNTGGNEAEQNWDSYVRAYFDKLGFNIFDVDDDDNLEAIFSGSTAPLVYVSESVVASKIGSRLFNVPATVIIDEPSLFAPMGMTGGGNASGDLPAQNSVTLVSASLGLPMGIMGSYTAPSSYWFDMPSPVGYGVPTSSALQLMMADGSSTRSTLFVYTTSSYLVGNVPAPGNRVGFFGQPGMGLGDDGNLIKHVLLEAARYW